MAIVILAHAIRRVSATHSHRAGCSSPRLALNHLDSHARHLQVSDLDIREFHHVEDDCEKVFVLAVGDGDVPEELDQRDLNMRNHSILIFILFLLLFACFELLLDRIELVLQLLALGLATL